MPGTMTSAMHGALHRIRRDAWLAAIGAAAAIVLAGLIAAWVLGPLRAWAQPSPVPLILVLTVLAGIAGVGVVALRRWIAVADEANVAAATESRLGLAAGSVRGILELGRAVPEGVSTGLYRQAEARLGATINAARAQDLGGDLSDWGRRRRARAVAAAAGSFALAMMLGFAAPERMKAGIDPLMHPVAHLSPPPLPPLVVQPGDQTVDRGGSLRVEIEAPGRAAVVLRWRSEGDVARKRTLGVSGGAVATRVDRIDSSVRYWVEAPDGAVSDTFTITPVDPLLVSDLVVDVRYPAYLERQDDRFTGEVPPLEIPAGTELLIRGRATRPLSQAALMREGAEGPVTLHTDQAAFTARWTPRVSGTYAWQLRDADGGASAAAPTPLELTVIADAAPHVEIIAPGADTVFGPDLRLAVTADARDDHRIRAAALVSWRIAANGQREAPVTQPIQLGETAERFLLDVLLDGSGRSLVPGDTLRYHVRVIDDAPGGQVGVSRTYSVRIPAADEMRERAVAEADAMSAGAASLANRAKQLEQATKELARRTSGSAARRSGQSGMPGGSPTPSQPQMGFEEAEKARQVLQRQEAMVEQVESMRENAEMLRRAMEAAGLNDPELQQRMQELRDLYDQILSPELRQQMEQLRKALEKLDPQEMQRALEQLAQQQEEFRKRMEQSVDLLKRAAAEQRMNALAQEARELAAQQKALAEALAAEPPSRARAEQQRDLAERADSLGKAMEELRQQLAEQGEVQAAEQTAQAGEKVETAEEQMDRAADAAEKGAGKQPEAEKDPRTGRSLPKLPQIPQLPKPQIEIGKKQPQGGSGSKPSGSPSSGEQSGAKKPGEADAKAGDSGKPQSDEKSGQQGESGKDATKSGGQGAGQKPQGTQGQAGTAQGQGGRSGGQSGAPQGQKPSAAQAQGADGGKDQKPGQQNGAQGQNNASGQEAAKSGMQAASQLEQAAKQLDAARKSMAQSWKQEVQEKVDAATNDALSLAQRQEALRQQMQQAQQQGGQPSAEQLAQMRAEQAALKQGLESMGRNLSEAGQRSALLNRDVGAALGRSMLSMQQSLDALEGRDGQKRMPVQEAQESVDALNRLALSLLQNSEQIANSQSGTGMQEAMQQMAELGKQQGSLNGQSGSLMGMGLPQQALAQQLQQLAARQAEIAKSLTGMNDAMGGQSSMLGRLDALAREADMLARELAGGRMDPELRSRQERLFHRLLDAGRSMERDETTDQRVPNRPAELPASRARALDPALLDAAARYRVPTPEQLQGLPPAYRRLILEYFDRLNRSPESPATTAPATGSGSR